MSITDVIVNPLEIRVDYTTVGDEYLKNNFYQLALESFGSGRHAHVDDPKSFRVVNAKTHEAQLVFPATGAWNSRLLTYYPAGLNSNPYDNQGGVVVKRVPANQLELSVPLK